MSKPIRDDVFEALNNARGNGYLDLLMCYSVDQCYVDLCDYSAGISELPEGEVKKAIIDWFANEAEGAYERQQAANLENPPKTLLEQQREAQKYK